MPLTCQTEAPKASHVCCLERAALHRVPLALAPQTQPRRLAGPCPCPCHPPAQLPVPLLSAAAMESVRSLRWSPSPSSGGLREAAYGLERQLSKKLPRHKNRSLALSAILLLCFAVRGRRCGCGGRGKLHFACKGAAAAASQAAGRLAQPRQPPVCCGASVPGASHSCRTAAASMASSCMHAPFIFAAPCAARRLHLQVSCSNGGLRRETNKRGSRGCRGGRRQRPGGRRQRQRPQLHRQHCLAGGDLAAADARQLGEGTL